MTFILYYSLSAVTDFLSIYGVINSKGYLWVYTRMGEHIKYNFLMLSWQFNTSSTQYNNHLEFSTNHVNRTNYIHKELHMWLWVLCPFNGNHCYQSHTGESSKSITGEKWWTHSSHLYFIKISRLRNLLLRQLRSPRAFFQALFTKREEWLLTRYIKGFNTGYLQPPQELQQTLYQLSHLHLKLHCPCKQSAGDHRGKWIFWNRWKFFM